VERLRGFYADLATGCAEALIALERMQAWRARADAAVADLSGRTPRLLVALLAARVAVSAQDAADATGVSVSAAQRNLALLTKRGLAREITGQGRFRMWRAP
jgi:Fic family protein